jgi:hypothetical protein
MHIYKWRHLLGLTVAAAFIAGANPVGVHPWTTPSRANRSRYGL